LLRLCVWRGGGVREFQDLVYMKGRENEKRNKGEGKGTGKLFFCKGTFGFRRGRGLWG